MTEFVGSCPSCQHSLVVTSLQCPHCGVTVGGRFELPPALSLSPDLSRFLSLFVRARGNLKEMERLLGVSYPTVRSKLDQLVAVFERDAAAGAGVAHSRPPKALGERDAGRSPTIDADPLGSPEASPDLVRARILSQIARGELSVDDAIRQLNTHRGVATAKD